MEFFCENCGKTVDVRPTPKEPKFWPTRIIAAFAALVSLLLLISRVLMSVLYDTHWTIPWASFGSPAAWLIISVLLLVFAKKIKQKESYSRWLSIAPFLYAVYLVGIMWMEYIIFNYEYNIDFEYDINFWFVLFNLLYKGSMLLQP